MHVEGAAFNFGVLGVVRHVFINEYGRRELQLLSFGARRFANVIQARLAVHVFQSFLASGCGAFVLGVVAEVYQHVVRLAGYFREEFSQIFFGRLDYQRIEENFPVTFRRVAAPVDAEKLFQFRSSDQIVFDGGFIFGKDFDR